MTRSIIFAILLCSIYCACIMTLQEDPDRVNQNLCEAVLCGNSQLVRSALQEGACINYQNNFFFDDTPLHMAIRGGYRDIMRQLLLYPGINVNLQDFTGMTALHLAVQNSDKNVVRCLLSKIGIDVNVQDIRGRTALMIAVYKNDEVVVDKLLTHGASVHIKNNNGYTAIDCVSGDCILKDKLQKAAASYSDVECCRLG